VKNSSYLLAKCCCNIGKLAVRQPGWFRDEITAKHLAWSVPTIAPTRDRYFVCADEPLSAHPKSPSPALRGRPSRREGDKKTLPLGGSDAVAAGEGDEGRGSRIGS
jgi:hypothetical protein